MISSELVALDVVVTSSVTTRLVEVDLGRRYRTGHDLAARSGSGYPVYLRPHRVRVLLRRDESRRWIVTQVIVIGRPVLALIRHEHDGGPLPSERQRTWTDLATAPSWVADVVRALTAGDELS